MVQPKRLLTLLIFLVPISQLLAPYNIEMVSLVVGKPSKTLENPSIYDKLLSSGNEVFLPGTNLSVTEYLDGDPKNTFNTSILSMNDTHWEVRCDYSIAFDWGATPFNSPFYSTINRTGFNNAYNATDYYNWQGFPQSTFDFWLDTSVFSDGYNYDSGGVTMTVTAENNFYLAGMGTYDAWKITGTVPLFNDIVAWYSKTGLFLSLSFTFTSEFWYNLTYQAFNEAPEGTIISPISPTNNTVGSVVPVKWNSNDSLSTDLMQNVYISQNQERKLIVSEGIRPKGTHKVDVLTTSLQDGSGYYIELDISDGFVTISLNSSALPFSIEKDKNLPNITVLQPVEMAYYQSTVPLTYVNDTPLSFFYLDGVNQSIPSSGHTFSSLPDGSHNITLVSRNATGSETKVIVNFIVDTTAPNIMLSGFENKTYRTDSVSGNILVNEDCNITYNLNGWNKTSFLAISGIGSEISFSDLPDNNYSLTILAKDFANNTSTVTISFIIYTSAFEISWPLEAKTPRTLTIVDDIGKLWFELTLASKTDQNFSLTVLPSGAIPTIDNQLLSAVKFICDKPSDIIYMTFAYKINASMITDSKTPILKWHYWNNQSSQWLEIKTNYNDLISSWEATFEGNITYFTLVQTKEYLELETTIPTGGGLVPFLGQIELIIVLFFCIISRKSIYRNKKY